MRAGDRWWKALLHRLQHDGDAALVPRWWSVKHESIYLHEFATVRSLEQGLEEYFHFYCHERPHQALDYRTPATVYRQWRNTKS